MAAVAKNKVLDLNGTRVIASYAYSVGYIDVYCCQDANKDVDMCFVGYCNIKGKPDKRGPICPYRHIAEVRALNVRESVIKQMMWPDGYCNGKDNKIFVKRVKEQLQK